MFTSDNFTVVEHLCDMISYGYQLHVTLRAIHLTTHKYSIHIATDSFSTELFGLLDRLAEASIGHFTIHKIDCSKHLLKSMQTTSLINASTIDELVISVQKYLQYLTSNVDTEIQVPDILNIIHDISLACKKFVYLLRLE